MQMTIRKVRIFDVDDFLGTMAQNDRATFTTICKTLATDCTNIDPEGVDFRNGVILRSDWQLGKKFLLNFELDTNITESVWESEVEIDNGGRIISLMILSKKGPMYDLPVSIGSLGQLENFMSMIANLFPIGRFQNCPI